MNGEVRSLQLLLPVTFRLADGRTIQIEFVVDTGFTGELTLPQSAIDALGLAYDGFQEAKLADAEKHEYSRYAAEIVWQGEVRNVIVLALGKRPLLGTGLMENMEIFAQFIENGLLTLDNI